MTRTSTGPSVSQNVDTRLRGVRLLIVADSSTTHTHRWAGWFRDVGCDVTVLSCATEPIEGVRVIPFPVQKRWYHSIPKVRLLGDLLPFRRLIRQIDPQLVHFHFVSEGGRAFYWDGVDVPMVASAWGQDVIFDTGPQPKLEKSLRRMLDRCQYLTATTWQLAAATAGFAPRGKLIHIIPFGVDVERFSPPRQPAAPRNQVVLGFVKHLLPKYGPDVMVEAFAGIHRRRPNTRLVLAGRGSMHEALQRRVDQMGLVDVVSIPGRVAHEQVPDLVRSFDIMVMPSIYESETFGVAAIEASACAVPVVASRVGGVPEAVLHEKTGLLVPPRDADALAGACIRLIDDADLRRRLGEAGRRFVERHYVWQDNARMMERVYEAALEGRPVEGVPVFNPGGGPDLDVE